MTEAERIEIWFAALNACAPERARAQFRRCCSSSRWIDLMEQARPFRDIAELELCADRLWASCSREDWLEAFAAHPRIGDQSGDRWSRQEQSGVSLAAPQVLEEISKANQAYEAKFGYTFIVCASGKDAAEMLTILKERLENHGDIELQNAAEQQRLIMRLRLKMLMRE